MVSRRDRDQGSGVISTSLSARTVEYSRRNLLPLFARVGSDVTPKAPSIYYVSLGRQFGLICLCLPSRKPTALFKENSEKVRPRVSCRSLYMPIMPALFDLLISASLTSSILYLANSIQKARSPQRRRQMLPRPAMQGPRDLGTEKAAQGQRLGAWGGVFIPSLADDSRAPLQSHSPHTTQ
jgi:hypothetical protein